jgi:hypothetical protein
MAWREQGIVWEQDGAFASTDHMLGSAELVGEPIPSVGLDQDQLC